MASQWFYVSNGQKAGPILSQELKKLADSGHLQSTDLVWREGLSEWVEARRVKGLMSDAGDSGIGLSGIRKAPASAPTNQMTVGGQSGAPVGASPPASDPQNVLRMLCPNETCGRMLRVPRELGGQAHACPVCGTTVHIPANPDQLPAIDPSRNLGNSSHQEPFQESPARGETTGNIPLRMPADLAPRIREQKSSRQGAAEKRRGVSALVGGGKRWFSDLAGRGEHRLRIWKVQNELRGLEKTIERELVEAGIWALEHHPQQFATNDLCSQLGIVATEVDRQSERIDMLKRSKGNWLLRRDLQCELKTLSTKRDQILAKIGRLAHQQRLLEDEPSNKLSQLEELRRERLATLSELGWEENGSTASGITTKFRSLAQAAKRRSTWTVLVVVLLGIGAAWCAFHFWFAAFLNPLYTYRYDIPDEADIVIMADMERLRRTEWWSSAERVFQRKMPQESIARGLRLDWAGVTSTVMSIVIDGSSDEFDHLGVIDGASVDYTNQAAEQYRTTKYRNHTIWIERTSSGQASCQIKRDRWILGTEDAVRAALDRRHASTPSKRYEELASWCEYVPRDTEYWAVLTALPNFGNRLNIDIKGGIVGVQTHDSEIHLEGQFFFPDAAEAKYFIDKVEEAAKRSDVLLANPNVWSAVRQFDVDVANQEALSLASSLLENLVIEYEDKAVTLSTSVPERRVVKLIEAALERESD